MRRNSLRENAAVIGGLLLLLAVCFYDVFFLGKTFKITTANSQSVSYGVYGQKDNKPRFIPLNGTDSTVLEEPNLEFVKTHITKGVVPLWNPHQACGFPFIGMLEVGIFFPLNFLVYFLPSLYGWDALIIGRFLLGGFFTFFFMRTLKFTLIPSFVAAVVYMLTGPMVLLQYWFVNVEIIAPLLLAAIERLLEKPKSVNLAFVAVTVGLTIFGGHPEHIFFVNLFALIYFFFRLITKKNIQRKKSVSYLCIAYLLGFGLGAIVLFPFLRNYLFEFWVNHPHDVGLTTGEVKNRVLTLILPHFFQKEPLTYDFTFAGWWGGYIGIVPFLLAFFSLFKRQKERLNYFFAAAAFLIIAKCYSVPVINWIGYLPIFNVSRFYIHTPHLFALCIAILAGMGIKALLESARPLKKGLMLYLLFALIIAGYLLVFKNAAHFLLSLRASLFAFGILTLFSIILFLKEKKILKTRLIALFLMVLLCGELFSYIHRERPRRFDSFPPVPYIEKLKSLEPRERAYGIFWSFYPNTASGYGVDDAGIFFSLLPKRFVLFINNIVIPDFFKSSLRPPALRVRPLIKEKPFLDLLNIGFFISPMWPKPNVPSLFEEKIKEENKQNTLVYAGEVNVYRRPDVMPRVFIVHRAVFEPTAEGQFKSLKEIRSRLREVAVIEGKPDTSITEQLAQSPLLDNSKAAIVSYSPNEVIIKTYLENPGFLMLSDAFHPDWRVYVNGKEEKMFAADYLFRTVFLPQGTFDVRYVFRPASFYLGAWVSFLSFILLAFLAITGRNKKALI